MVWALRQACGRAGGRQGKIEELTDIHMQRKSGEALQQRRHEEKRLVGSTQAARAAHATQLGLARAADKCGEGVLPAHNFHQSRT